MNVNRYMLIGREHNQTFEKISKWNINWVVAVTVFISLLANVAHAFQFELHTDSLYRHLNNISFIYIYPYYPAINHHSTALNIYLLAYFIFNFFVFFVANTFVEVVLVMKLHKELGDKKTRVDQMTANSINAPLSFRRKRKLDIEERTENRATSMVLINAMLNFFLRIPELSVIFSLAYSIDSYSFLSCFIDIFPNTRNFATDITYFFYILTFSTNFLVYYLFNQKFKQTFFEWRHVKKRN
jgi:hypothetical protein